MRKDARESAADAASGQHFEEQEFLLPLFETWNRTPLTPSSCESIAAVLLSLLHVFCFPGIGASSSSSSCGSRGRE